MQSDDPEGYQRYLYFSQGINDCVKSRKTMPLEYYLTGLKWTDWTVTDCMLIYMLLKWSQAFDYMDEFLRSKILETHSREEVERILAFTAQNWFQGENFKPTTIIKDS